MWASIRANMITHLFLEHSQTSLSLLKYFLYSRMNFAGEFSTYHLPSPNTLRLVRMAIAVCPTNMEPDARQPTWHVQPHGTWKELPDAMTFRDTLCVCAHSAPQVALLHPSLSPCLSCELQELQEGGAAD